MYCTKRITEDLVWVGGNDRRLAMFEGVYSVPAGVSYNAYLLSGAGETVLFDTVDKAVGRIFFENLEHELAGRKLDYVVVHHMEPDHSATLDELTVRYPNVKIICNAKTEKMLTQFFGKTYAVQLVAEGDVLTLAGHDLTFVMAPMVHWPEVMMTYDITGRTLFSADAFGAFGALNGAIFADEVDFDRDYMDEARRYYTNIVGKYGTQVQAVLKKAAGLAIDYICPLHGFVWRTRIGDFVDKYMKWSTYTPEEKGVLVAYASVYGNTENTAEIISSRLREKGIKTVMYDVSVTPASEIIAEAFRYSHMVLASTTYNAGIFVQMEAFLQDLTAHNIQNRTVAVVENGSWAPTSGKLMRDMLSKCRNITLLEETVTLRSALKESQLAEIDRLVDALAATMAPAEVQDAETLAPAVDETALFALSYGLYILSAREGDKDNACIINTASQAANKPNCIAISVNKQNLTHDMILRTGKFNLSVLTEDVPFKVFEHFGFHSGRDTDKFAGCATRTASANGLVYVPKYTNAFVSGRVVSTQDCGSHTLFVAEVTEARVLSDRPSVTYAYYFAHIKPQPQPSTSQGKIWVCKICGYIYDEVAEGVAFEDLPEDWVCPLCKHPKSDFERG